MNAKKLRALLKITNTHAYGDAIPTILMIEAIMKDRDYSVTMLYNLYKDYPSMESNVLVDYKDKWITKWDQTELTDPVNYQSMIQIICQEVQEACAYIRPSDTEDCLRLYVEAKDENACKRTHDTLIHELN